MNSSDRSADGQPWNRLEGAMDALLQLTPEARADWIIETVAEKGLRSELLALLPHLLEAESSCVESSPSGVDVRGRRSTGSSPESGGPPVLDQGLFGSLDSLLEDLDSDLATERAHRHGSLGAYELGSLLAVGGMGRVFRGYRSDGLFDREVAIKILRWELSEPVLLERFNRERQILAQLDHPAVAQMLDGGVTGDGVPYLVMELIEGRELLAYCQEEGLDLRQRIELVLPILDAVHAAHRQLIVHRDLKPSNVLVNHRGEAKLLDFGIAKLLDPLEERGATRTLSTPYTPAYASPEQLRSEPVGTASDVFSLGCLLYAVLAGDPPFPPVSPGTVDPRLLEKLPATASSISGESSELWSDLDAILLTAVDFDPARRYASADALAKDLRHLLAGRPVDAVPPSFLYRLRKSVGRHRLATALTVLTALSLIGGAALSHHQSLVAAAERDSAQRLAVFSLDLLRLGDPGDLGSTQISARELLEEGASRAVQVEAADVRGELLAVIGEGLLNLQVYDGALDALSEALGALDDVEQSSVVARTDLNTRVSDLLRMAARASAELGDLDRALRLNAEALQRIEGLALDESKKGVILYERAFLLARFTVAGSPRRAEIEDVLGRAIELLTRASPKRGSEALARSLHLLGQLRVSRLSLGGQREEEVVQAALAPMWRAVEMRQGLGEDNGIGLIVSYNDIALSLDRLGRLSEARTVFGEALATASERVDPSHPTLLAVRQNHAAILRAEGRLEEARTEYRTLTAAWESAGVDLPVKAVTGQAWVDALLGEPVRAEEALRGLEARITEEESYYWMVRAVLGESLRLQGRYDEARTVLEASLEPSVRVMGPDYEGTQLIRRALREIELRDPS